MQIQNGRRRLISLPPARERGREREREGAMFLNLIFSMIYIRSGVWSALRRSHIYLELNDWKCELCEYVWVGVYVCTCVYVTSYV